MQFFYQNRTHDMNNRDNTQPDTINKVQNTTNMISSVSEAGPLISVITITYNAAPVIRPTLESLNAQTFRNFEHLVIDGASKDDTVSIVNGMCPDSIVRSEPDRGLYDAMNKGLRAA